MIVIVLSILGCWLADLSGLLLGVCVGLVLTDAARAHGRDL